LSGVACAGVGDCCTVVAVEHQQGDLGVRILLGIGELGELEAGRLGGRIGGRRIGGRGVGVLLGQCWQRQRLWSWGQQLVQALAVAKQGHSLVLQISIVEQGQQYGMALGRLALGLDGSGGRSMSLGWMLISGAVESWCKLVEQQ
jgi:hypothetical protein